MGVLLSAIVALFALTLAPHLLFYFDITPKIVVLLVGTRQVLDLFGHSYAEQAAWSLRILSLESFPFIIKNHFVKTICRVIIINEQYAIQFFFHKF